MIKKEQIDVMLNIAKTPKRKEFLSFTSSYLKQVEAIFTKKDSNIKVLNQFNGKTLAVVKGFFEEEILRKYYPSIKLITTKNTIESLKLVSFGQADGAINNIGVGNNLISQYGLSNIEPNFEVLDDEFAVNLHLAVNKTNKILLQILEKGKNLITEEEIISLKNKWLASNNNKPILNLTIEEKYWIKTHNVKIGVEQWEPIDAKNNGSDIDGICGDFTKLIIQKTGLKIKVINDKIYR